MKLHRPSLMKRLVLLSAMLSPSTVFATPITGTIEPDTPLGQYMAMTMTVGDSTTTFEVTGPDFSFFAFGFDTTTMLGYALIIEGTDATRTAVEQNLLGVGNPGGPQPTQNIIVVNTTHDSAHDLTTLIIERPNHTGDPDDPDFSTSMTNLNLIWAYNSSASPQFPNPFLDYHGSDGRGLEVITFSPVPEPATLALGGLGAVFVSTLRRRLPPSRLWD